MSRIHTLHDARQAKTQADAKREHQRQVKTALAKVRRWERKVQQYGGIIHQETLARMRAYLAALEGQA